MKKQLIYTLIPYLAITTSMYFFQNPFKYLHEDPTINLAKQTIFYILLGLIITKTYLIFSNHKYTLNLLVAELGIFLGIYFSPSMIINFLTPSDGIFPKTIEYLFTFMHSWPVVFGLGLSYYFGKQHFQILLLQKLCTRKTHGKIIYKELSALKVNGRLHYNLTIKYKEFETVIKHVSHQIALNYETGSQIPIKINPKNPRQMILDF